MTRFVEALIRVVEAEWEFFGRSTRSRDNVWAIGGEESDGVFRVRVGDYWRAVGQPDWDGATDQPWSGAFVTWCFAEAGAGERFKGSAKHSIYIDGIRRRQRGNSALKLLDPAVAAPGVGDLIWNSRRTAEVSDAPRDFADAVARLKAGDFFPSHVDIVAAVRPGECDGIGGNVSNRDPGGSVTRSTWRTDAEGRLIDPRKTWIGVVRNGL